MMPDTLPVHRERLGILVAFMRMSAVVLLCAFPCAALPNAWMQATHAYLDIGPWPGGILVEYLARSASLLYGFLGLLTLYLSFDVPRYLPLILWKAKMTGLFGVLMLVVDIKAGLPLPWILGEGPAIIALGSVGYWLARRVQIT